MRIEISIVLGAFGLTVLPYVGTLGFVANATEASEPCTVIGRGLVGPVYSGGSGSASVVPRRGGGQKSTTSVDVGLSDEPSLRSAATCAAACPVGEVSC